MMEDVFTPSEIIGWRFWIADLETIRLRSVTIYNEWPVDQPMHWLSYHDFFNYSINTKITHNNDYFITFNNSGLRPNFKNLQPRLSTLEHIDLKQRGIMAGIYAYKTKKQCISEFCDWIKLQPIIYGRVYLWGTVIEHEFGYRAEYAKICSLNMIYSCINRDYYLRKFREAYNVI